MNKLYLVRVFTLLSVMAFAAGCSKSDERKPSTVSQPAENPPAPKKEEPPAPAPEPTPAPAPAPAPQPEPKPAPAPAPQPEPKPAPAPTPAPQPKPLPKPVPLPRPRPPQAPQPKPVPAPKPQPKPEPQPAPIPMPGQLPPADPSVGTPAWGNERREWTNAVRAIAFVRLREFERAADKESFCPGYSQANLNQRLNCWVLLVAAVSKLESAFKPGDSFREPDGNYSVGLLALSPNECPNAPTLKQLALPVPNLICGTNRMAALIAKDGYIDGPEGRQGASRYWSTLRAPYKRWDPSRKRYLTLGKKNEILPLVRSYRGSKVGKDQGPKGLREVLALVPGELMSCGAIEQLIVDDQTGQQKLVPIDAEVTLKSSDEVPSGVIAEIRSHGSVKIEKDSRVITVGPNDVGQALEIARAMYPDRDLSGVQSVRVGDVGVQANQHDSAGIVIYELLGANGQTLAKVLTMGWSFGRCGR